MNSFPDRSSGNIFGVSSFKPIESSTSFSSVPSRYSLGATPNSNLPANFFNVSTGSELMQNLNQPSVSNFSDLIGSSNPPNPNPSLDLMGSLVNNPSLNTLKNTSDLGKKLYEGSKKLEKSDSPLETATCEVVKTTTESFVESTTTGLLVGGVPLLVAESIACPPLALAIPFVVETLPTAYANAQELAKIAGKKAEADCHLLFNQYGK